MANYYLDFEQPLKEIDQKILELEGDSSSHKEELSLLTSEREDCLKKIFSNLTRWQKVQLARHPQRPLSMDYITSLSPNFIELHGDRYFGDDSAIVCGLGSIDDVKVVFLGQQKGKNTKENIYRNFGMMRPEGYRKVIRLMKLADKFNIPVVSFIDTPGAYPGVGAEERGQAEAIAKSIECCMELKVPTISIIIGEGGSGGAIALASSNKVLMLENAIYSVISPEGCATILWRDPKKTLEASKAMKLSSKDLLNLEIIDEIIGEPTGGAHRDKDLILNNVRDSLKKNLKIFDNMSGEEIFTHRKNKFLSIGRNKGFTSHINISKNLSMENSLIEKIKNKIKKKNYLLGIFLIVIFSIIIISQL